MADDKDYIVEFFDAADEVIGDQEIFLTTDLPALLRLLSRRVIDDPSLDECCGMNIRQVDGGD